jgi:hypothetical protein
MSSILISFQEVDKFLLDDERCTQELREEVVGTIDDIDAKEGRRWAFTPIKKKYYIDEYNEYNDFVKTYTFRL